MKFSDRPISRPDQDAFGRAKFASFLATAIDNLPVSTVAKDGYIIAVHGKWGAGKTSTVELAIRYLRHIEMERASHIALPPNRDSNPRTRDELEVMARTFEEIEGRILSIENQNKDPTRWEPSSRFKEFLKWLGSEESARVADYYWQLKVYVDKNPRTLVVRFSPWIFSGRVELASALLSELARTLGQRLGPDVRAAFGQVLGRLAELAPIGASGIDLLTGSGFGRALSLGGPLLRKLADRMTAGPSLEELRSQLKLALRTLASQQVLVVVDDLDRLTPPEALEMLTIVKGLGDLPNVVYILVYDEETLSRLLNTALSQSNNGDYLEKIVQYSTELPIIDIDDIGDFLQKDLTEFFASLSKDDQSRFRFAWTYFLRHYLLTPRDVKRLVNHYYFIRLTLKEYTDPIDLLILEVLRLHEPGVYSWLRANISDLVS